MLPRFFIASARSPQRSSAVDDAARLEDVLATIVLRGAPMIVGRDAAGALRVVEGAHRDRLPASVRAKLAYHEVAGRRPAHVDAERLFVFELQLVELLRDAPGLNDPLYLYGSLRGPYPDGLAAPTAAVDGQLTVSRSDVLTGLIDGVADAFHMEPTAHGARCVHAVLPAGDPGVAIAVFPLTLTSLAPTAANEPLVAQIFYDVLRALRTDLGIADALPVPKRAAMEKELVADGWRIEGDEAVRVAPAGVLKKLFGRAEERRPLPAQGSLEGYAAEATRLLPRLGGNPPRVAPVPTTPPPRPTPVPTTLAPPPAVPPPMPRPAVSTPSSEWMKDFVDTHRAPGRRAPKLSPARPDWMSDFDDDDD